MTTARDRVPTSHLCQSDPIPTMATMQLLDMNPESAEPRVPPTSVDPRHATQAPKIYPSASQEGAQKLNFRRRAARQAAPVTATRANRGWADAHGELQFANKHSLQ